MATPDFVQVEVVSRIPKYARRLGRVRPPMLRLRVGAFGEVPPWMVERWPDALRVIAPAGTENPKLEPAELVSTEPVGSVVEIEAAITSDIAPTKPPQPIKPPRTPRKRATTPRRRKAASKESTHG